MTSPRSEIDRLHAGEDSRASGFGTAVKQVFKAVAIVTGLVITVLPALTCRVESWFSDRDEWFLFWAQTLALIPGVPGKYLRKCFYFLTLQSCSLDSDFGFMSYFNDPKAEVGKGVYIGFAAGVGKVSIGAGCLVGSRASLLNGGSQHRHGPDGKLTPFDRASARRIRIGKHTWIGEGAIIMADVGNQCIVGAGSVVSEPVPDGCLVAGNPARFIRRLIEEPRDATGSETYGDRHCDPKSRRY